MSVFPGGIRRQGAGCHFKLGFWDFRKTRPCSRVLLQSLPPPTSRARPAHFPVPYPVPYAHAPPRRVPSSPFPSTSPPAPPRRFRSLIPHLPLLLAVSLNGLHVTTLVHALDFLSANHNECISTGASRPIHIDVVPNQLHAP